MSNMAAAQRSLLKNLQASNYLDFAAALIMLYDHIITLDLEVEFVWTSSKERRTMNILFVMNRVFGDLTAFGLLAEAGYSWSSSSCKGVRITTFIAQSFQYVIWAFFSAIRVYSVGGKGRLLTFIVFLLAMVPVATNLYDDGNTALIEEQFSDMLSLCIGSSTQVVTSLLYVARGTLVTADVIVIAVTVKNTYGIKHEGPHAGKSTVSERLWRDGSVYFFAMVILNVASMVVSGATDHLVGVVPIVSAISTVIIARFFLNLRETAKLGSDAPRSIFSVDMGSSREMGEDMHWGTRMVVGGMGAELQSAFGFGGEEMTMPEIEAEEMEGSNSTSGGWTDETEMGDILTVDHV